MNTHRITWTADGPEFPVLPIDLLTAAPIELVEYVLHLEAAIRAMHATGCATDAEALRVAMADLVDEWRGLSNCYAASGALGDRAQAVAYHQCSGQLGRLANAALERSAVAGTLDGVVGGSNQEDKR